MRKKAVSKEEYRQVIDEILATQNVLKKDLGEYSKNAIDRLIMARIKLEGITVKRASNVPKGTEEKKQ